MFNLKLAKARETKNTVRYEAPNTSPITVLYIQKASLSTPYPEAIQVAVTAHSTE